MLYSSRLINLLEVEQEPQVCSLYGVLYSVAESLLSPAGAPSVLLIVMAFPLFPGTMWLERKQVLLLL
jgi:hypothetical protein